MAIRALLVGVGAALPLAAAACGGSSAQVSPSPTAAAASEAPAGNPASPSPPRRAFLQQLLADGNPTHLVIDRVPGGTTCSGRVVWKRGTSEVKAANIPTMTNPSGSSRLNWDSPLGSPPGGIVVAWSVDCSLLDRSQGSAVLRFQHIEASFSEPSSGGSSARIAPPP